MQLIDSQSHYRSNDHEPLSPTFKVSTNELLDCFESIVSLKRYSEHNIWKEYERVKSLCVALDYQEIGMKELHTLLNFPKLMTLSEREVQVRSCIDELSICYRIQGTNTYITPSENEFELLKDVFEGLGRFTAAAWMNLAFYTHLVDGVEMGWSTLDVLFQSKQMRPTHPDTWQMNLFQ